MTRIAAVVIWLLLPAMAVSADWRLTGLGYPDGPIPELTFSSARPIATIGDADPSGILSSEPPLPWECLILSEHELSCRVDHEIQEQPIALASRIDFTLAGDRLTDQQGAALGGTTLVLPTPLPALRVKPDWEESDPHLLRVIAPMQLSTESIQKALQVSIDDEPVDYALRVTGPLQRLDFNNHVWPAMPLRLSTDARHIWWSARVTHAWELRLSRLPEPGQTLAMRLRGGLASEQGELTNQPLDAEQGDLILTFTAPTELVALASCADGSRAAYRNANNNPEWSGHCAPEYPLSLQFSAPLSPATLEAIAATTPQSLVTQLPAAPAPVFARTFGFEFPEVLELQPFVLTFTDVDPSATYQLSLGETVSGLFGEATSTPEVVWKTVAWQPTVTMAPKLSTYRRGEPTRVQMFLRGQDQIGAELNWTLADGSNQQQDVEISTDPLLAEAANLPLPFPSDQALVGSAVSDPPQSARELSVPPGLSDAQAEAYLEHLRATARVVVTDFGLHTLRVGGQLIVVVSDLDRGGPVSGVELRILAGTDEVARAQSSEQGVARLDWPQRDGDQELLLVAQRGTRAAVLDLPVGEGFGYSIQSGDRYTRWNRRSGALALYTDKPLYRLGDRVRYRLFASRQESAHFPTYGIEGEAFTIQIRRDGTTLQTVAARWDAFGGYGGEFELPAEGPDGGFELSVDHWAIEIPVVEHTAPRIAVALSLPQGAMVSGDTLPVRAQVLRTSGEPLVAVEMSLVGRMVPQREPFAKQFPGFRFNPVDPDQEGLTAACDRAEPMVAFLEPTNANGISFSHLSIGERPCEFYLGSVAAAPTRGLPGSRLSAAQTVIQTRRARYLGLAGMGYGIQSPGAELTLRALAVDARSLAPMPDIEALIEVRRADSDRVVMRCELLADGYAGCDWTAANAGDYQIRLTADGFEPLEVMVEVADQGYGTVHRKRLPRLVLEKELWQPGERVEMDLSHAHELAQAVILVTDANGLMDAQWHRLEQRLQRIYWQPAADLAGAFRLSVLVIPAPGAGPLESAQVEGAKLRILPAPPALFDLEVPALAKPGDEVLVRVRSIHDQPLNLVMSGYDDALSGLLPSAMQARQIDLWWLARAIAYPPAPIFRTLLQQFGCFEFDCADQTEIGTIEVTSGSPRSPFDDPDLSGTDSDLRRQLDDDQVMNASALVPAGLRRRFASAFWWRAHEPLRPGESREFRVRLPDDLTRWRFEVVAQNPQLETQQRAATTDARQPLALQTDAPKHLYPGDQSQLSAALYSAVDVAQPIDWEIQAPGLAASVRQRLSPERNRPAELQLSVAAGEPGTQPWWTRAEGGNDPPLGDGMLSSLVILDPVQMLSTRQIGLIPAAGIQLQAEQLIEESSRGEISISVGLDPLFGLAGVLKEGLRREPWVPDNALDQLLSAALAQKLGHSVDLPRFVAQAETLLLKYRVDEGWSRFPAWSDEAERGLSRRVLLRLAELRQLGVALTYPPIPAPEQIWQSPADRAESLPGSTLLARRLSWRALSSLPTQGELNALLAESSMTLEASARLSLFLADSTTHADQLQAAQARLRESLTGASDAVRRSWSDLPATAERCLALRALVLSDFREDALPVQRRALAALYSPWGSTLPRLDHESIRHCLQAAQAFAERWLKGGQADVLVRLGSAQQQMRLTAGGETLQLQQDWNTSDPMPIELSVANSTLASYEIAYRRPIDRRAAPAQGAAIRISRQYRLFRDGSWLPAGSAALVGDWVHVELQIRAAKPVSHAAVLEPLPGALIAVDPTLEGGVDPRLSGEVEHYWGSAKLGGPENLFLLRGLTPGLNKLGYLARVSHPGDYAWPGPQIELIYAPQVNARGASERLVVAGENR